MHPALMAMPGSGTGPAAAPGAGGAGAAVGADVLSDMGNESDGNVDADPYGVPINEDEPFAQTDGDGFSQSPTDGGAADNQSEWATFEEPDHGFEDPFPDENALSDDGEGWGAGAGGLGDADGEGSRGLIGTIMDIFFHND